MSFIILICTILGITASGVGGMMGQSRILQSYAKDGLLFEVFKDMDPVKKIPIKGSWIALLPICAASFCMNLTELAKLCTLANLITYAFIDAAVIFMRL